MSLQETDGEHKSINEVADLEEVEVSLPGEVYISEADVWTAIVKVDGHETHFKLEQQFPLSVTRNLGSKTTS